jgi:hypothetical protein
MAYALLSLFLPRVIAGAGPRADVGAEVLLGAAKMFAAVATIALVRQITARQEAARQVGPVAPPA